MRNNCHIDTRWRSFAVFLHSPSFRLLPSIIYTYNYSSTFAARTSCPVACCLLPMILNRGWRAECNCQLFVCLFFFFLFTFLPANEWLFWPGPIKCDWVTGWKPNARCTLQLPHKSNLINRGQKNTARHRKRSRLSIIGSCIRDLFSNCCRALRIRRVCLVFKILLIFLPLDIHL